MAAAIPLGATLLEAAWLGLSRLMMSKGGVWIAQALLTLGFEIGTIAVFSTPFVQKARDAMGGIPVQIIDWAGMANVDIYVSMIISAVIIRETKKGARAALLKAGRR